MRRAIQNPRTRPRDSVWTVNPIRDAWSELRRFAEEGRAAYFVGGNRAAMAGTPPSSMQRTLMSRYPISLCPSIAYPFDGEPSALSELSIAAYRQIAPIVPQDMWERGEIWATGGMLADLLVNPEAGADFEHNDFDFLVATDADVRSVVDFWEEMGHEHERTGIGTYRDGDTHKYWVDVAGRIYVVDFLLPPPGEQVGYRVISYPLLNQQIAVNGMQYMTESGAVQCNLDCNVSLSVFSEYMLREGRGIDADDWRYRTRALTYSLAKYCLKGMLPDTESTPLLQQALRSREYHDGRSDQ